MSSPPLTPQPPLAQEANTFLFDCFAGGSVDHTPVILGGFFAQVSRRCEQVAQLVIGAALHRNLRPLRSQRRH
jgi:hypothetical protein